MLISMLVAVALTWTSRCAEKQLRAEVVDEFVFLIGRRQELCQISNERSVLLLDRIQSRTMTSYLDTKCANIERYMLVAFSLSALLRKIIQKEIETLSELWVIRRTAFEQHPTCTQHFLMAERDSESSESEDFHDQSAPRKPETTATRIHPQTPSHCLAIRIHNAADTASRDDCVLPSTNMDSQYHTHTHSRGTCPD